MGFGGKECGTGSENDDRAPPCMGGLFFSRKITLSYLVEFKTYCERV